MSVTVAICSGRRAWIRVAEGADDSVEIAEDLRVHLDEALLSSGLGGGNYLQDLAAMFMVLRKKFCCSDEHRTGQAALACGHVFCTGRPQ